jgi:hypothetical protein
MTGFFIAFTLAGSPAAVYAALLRDNLEDRIR